MTTTAAEVSGTPKASTVVAVRRAKDSDGSIAAFSSQGNFEAAQRMAKALSSSSLVPENYRGNLPNALIAMELASRIGASVFMVMQNLDIIHGRPSWRAQFLIATVNSSGRFSPLRYRFEGEEGADSWGCRAVAHDRETGEECVGSLITIGLAKAEGWYSKSGSKWKSIPEQMLRYRAAAFWTRVYCPELSMGMHTVDEVEDSEDRRPAPSVPAQDFDAALQDIVEVEATVVDGSDAEDPDAEGEQDAGDPSLDLEG